MIIDFVRIDLVGVDFVRIDLEGAPDSIFMLKLYKVLYLGNYKSGMFTCTLLFGRVLTGKTRHSLVLRSHGRMKNFSAPHIENHK